MGLGMPEIVSERTAARPSYAFRLRRAGLSRG